MGSSWIGGGPKSMPSVLTGDREEKTWREEEAESGGTWPQGKPRLEPPEARRGGQDAPRPNKEQGPANTVISGSRPPQLAGGPASVVVRPLFVVIC